ncbi:MAG: ABC transporter ATP-binding protein [Candidatus Omnitrophota bacterium]
MAETALSLTGVGVTYKGKNYTKEALFELSFRVERGEIFGFLGPNGAGKTTTIKAILNLIYPNTGQIEIFGCPASKVCARKRIGYMPEIANYYWYLTAKELLLMYAGILNIPKALALKRIDSFFEIVGLQDAGNVLMKNFSKGMMQKVSLAQALLNDPDLLILDEPAGGLDPVARTQLRSLILELKNKGKTVFFSSHELSEVELICDRVGILKEGRLLKTEKVKDILNQKTQHQSLENYFLNIIKPE